MKRFLPYLALFLLFVFFAAACNPGSTPVEENAIDPSPTINQSLEVPETPTSAISEKIEEATVAPNPEPANPADIPGYHQSVPLDGIRPVYNPQFVRSEEVASLMFEDELVMGVAWDGEAKAYPVTVLRFREIVNDELAGIPTLVTW